MEWPGGKEQSSLRLLDIDVQHSIMYAEKEKGNIKGPRVMLEGHGDIMVEGAKITVKLHIQKGEFTKCAI